MCRHRRFVPALAAAIVAFRRGGWGGLKSGQEPPIVAGGAAGSRRGRDPLRAIAGRFRHDPERRNASSRCGHGLPTIAFYLILFSLSLRNGPANVAMLGGPLSEEGGCRGCLLPHLSGRFGNMRAALAVGAVWACWHLSTALQSPEWRDGMALRDFLPSYAVWVMRASCLISKICWCASGSLLSHIRAHGVINAPGDMAFNPHSWERPWREPVLSPEKAVLSGAMQMALVFMLEVGGLRLMRRWPILLR